MKPGETYLANIDENLHDFRFRESLTEPSIHHVYNAAARAELHEDVYLMGATSKRIGCCIDKIDNIGVSP